MPFPGAFYKGLNGERRRGSKVVSKGGQGTLVSGRICLRIFLYIFSPFFFFWSFLVPCFLFLLIIVMGKKTILMIMTSRVSQVIKVHSRWPGRRVRQFPSVCRPSRDSVLPWELCLKISAMLRIGPGRKMARDNHSLVVRKVTFFRFLFLMLFLIVVGYFWGSLSRLWIGVGGNYEEGVRVYVLLCMTVGMYK